MTKSTFPRAAVLACPMGHNDAKADTVGDYLLALARTAWVLEEDYSGKRPFGNSGWRNEVIDALLEAGLAATASEAVDMVTEALRPVVNDPDLPASMQGQPLPPWWDSSDDPFEDQHVIATSPRSGRGCCGFGCTCRT